MRGGNRTARRMVPPPTDPLDGTGFPTPLATPERGEAWRALGSVAG